MKQAVKSRTGGEILVDALRIHGVDTAYCVPGESFLAVLDALYHVRDELKLIVCRQEGGATHMAEAHGKLTGKPGICFVTRGPGATNASIAVHTASQDSTPLILFVGQVARDCIGREAWQEIDYSHMYADMAKWVAQIDDATRIPEMISRAFHIATSGRPGPVVLALPEDMLAQTAIVADSGAYRVTPSAPEPEAMLELKQRLLQAQRPLVVLGGGGWNAAGSRAIGQFASSFHLPVICGFRRQDLMDNQHPCYGGEAGLGMNPKLAERIQQADLIISVGARLGETSTNGYTLLAIPTPVQQLVHVHPDPQELGRVYQATLPITSDVNAFSSAAAKIDPIDGRVVPWQEWTRQAREDYLATLVPEPMAGPLNLGEVVRHVAKAVSRNAIITNGAGNYTLWVQRFYEYGQLRTQLAPTSGTMGYGMPAVIAAKIVHPEREAICFAGDGCFLMNGQELATAIQYGLDPIIIVVNNGMYGSIRMHQEKHYPGRVHGTELHNPDFVALAIAYGAHAERVEHTADFPAAFSRARSAKKAALIELCVDKDALSPKLSISGLRKKAGIE